MNSIEALADLVCESPAGPARGPGTTTTTLPSDGSILIASHPWLEWDHLAEACAESMPSAIVFVASCQFKLPPEEVIAPLRDAGIALHWVLGNQFGDDDKVRVGELWHRPDPNLSGRSLQLGDLSVAGLGGRFLETAWWPKTDPDAPARITRGDCVAALLQNQRWRHGLPPVLREAIFPEDIAAFQGLRADVLVTTAPPTGHRYGFAAVDRAAAVLGARVVIHGAAVERHERWELPGGVQVRGVLMGEVIRLRREDLA